MAARVLPKKEDQVYGQRWRRWRRGIPTRPFMHSMIRGRRDFSVFVVLKENTGGVNRARKSKKKNRMRLP
jgi:hypothetical protein